MEVYETTLFILNFPFNLNPFFALPFFNALTSMTQVQQWDVCVSLSLSNTHTHTRAQDGFSAQAISSKHTMSQFTVLISLLMFSHHKQSQIWPWSRPFTMQTLNFCYHLKDFNMHVYFTESHLAPLHNLSVQDNTKYKQISVPWYIPFITHLQSLLTRIGNIPTLSGFLV
jgi:hypothetical protein